jgi:hypothetical protein
MSPDDHITVQNRAADVIKACVAAHLSPDPAQCCFDIVSAAALVAGDDSETKSALALFMLRMAQRLDRDVTNATSLQ